MRHAMKLPEYDNRPLPGTPLYSNPDEGKGNLKWPALFIGLILAFCVIIYSLFDSIIDLFR